ncbi:MAG: hypothetical protein WA960_20795 [Tunicatimonas sp.]
MRSLSILLFALLMITVACSVQSNKEGDVDDDFTDEEILDNNDFNSSFPSLRITSDGMLTASRW